MQSSIDLKPRIVKRELRLPGNGLGPSKIRRGQGEQLPDFDQDNCSQNRGVGPVF